MTSQYDGLRKQDPDSIFKQPLTPLSSPGSDRAIQYSRGGRAQTRGRGVLDRPLEPVIGLAGGETRWPAMTAECRKKTRHRIPAAHRARVVRHMNPLEKDRGRREGRVPAAPVAPARKGLRGKHEDHRVKAEAFRPSLRGWFYGLLRALLGEPDSVATVALRYQRFTARSGSTRYLQDLAPASGRQDHTTSPSAPLSPDHLDGLTRRPADMSTKAF